MIARTELYPRIRARRAEVKMQVYDYVRAREEFSQTQRQRPTIRYLQIAPHVSSPVGGLGRHCEERQRRSNPGPLGCFATARSDGRIHTVTSNAWRCSGRCNSPALWRESRTNSGKTPRTFRLARRPPDLSAARPRTGAA